MLFETSVSCTALLDGLHGHNSIDGDNRLLEGIRDFRVAPMSHRRQRSAFVSISRSEIHLDLPVVTVRDLAEFCKNSTMRIPPAVYLSFGAISGSGINRASASSVRPQILSFAAFTGPSIGRVAASASGPSRRNLTTTTTTTAFVSAKGTTEFDSNRNATTVMFDSEYPGTAVERMMNVRARVTQLAANDELTGSWEDVRRRLLWAGGLKDLPDAAPGQGYTGHSFNDFNHVDLTCMLDQVSDNENDGQVKGIAIGNRLGPGVRIASLPEVGPGGSWTTCAMGCSKDPPADVAHLQFRSRIAFKLVWVPNERFDSFVLVDDDGKLLAHGKGLTDALPPLRERRMNYNIVAGSKYAKEADKIADDRVAAE